MTAETMFATEKAPLPLRAWVPIVLPPAAWTIQEWAGWYVGALVCRGLPLGSARGIMAAVSIAAIVTVAICLVAPWRDWRGGRSRGLTWRAPFTTTAEFLTAGRILVGAPFLVAVLYAAAGDFFIHQCGAAQ